MNNQVNNKIYRYKLKCVKCGEIVERHNYNKNPVCFNCKKKRILKYVNERRLKLKNK